MRSADSHLDFDLTTARTVQKIGILPAVCSCRGYVQIREADKVIVPDSENILNEHLLDHETSSKVIKPRPNFQRRFRMQQKLLEPHKIATYLMRLAQSFHRVLR